MHVLGTPPAFILSQDQTLRINVISFNINIRLDVCFHFDLLIGFDRASYLHKTFSSSYHSSVVKVLGFRFVATKNRCPGILHAVHRPLRHLDDFTCRFGCYAIFRSLRSTDRLFLARSEFYLIPRACQGFCSSTFSLSFLIGLLLWSGSFLLAGDCQTIACLVQRVVLYTLPLPCQGYSK